MTAKEYLGQYLEAKRDILDKLEEIKRLRDMACKITQTITPDRVQTSTSNRMDTVLPKKLDLDSEVCAEITELMDKRREVMRAIDSVPNASQRAVLRKRYIFDKRWEEIAVELNYTYRHVTRLHGEALQYIAQNVLVCPSRPMI